MDKIRDQFDSIIDDEKSRQKAVVYAASWPFWVTSAMALVASIFLVVMIVALRRADYQIQAQIEQIEDQLEQARERERKVVDLTTLINHAYDAIIVRDPDSKVKFWNEGAVKLYGHRPAEAEGKVTHQLLETKFPGGRDGKKQVDQYLNEEPHKWDGRLEHRTKRGGWVVVQSRQVQTTDAAQHPVILEINRDVTASENILLHVNHDLRDPLTTIIGTTKQGMNDTTLPSIKSRLKIIDVQAKAMHRLTQSMLAVFKPEIKLEKFILDELCEQLKAEHPDSVDKGTSLTIETTGVEPQCVVTTDRQMLSRCLSNLLVNAFDYAPGGDIVLEIKHARDQRMIFAVIDNGPGIDVNERSKVLETSNFQGRSGAGKGGIGLGLTMAKQSAERLGGSLKYYPVEPHGCRFEVVIPVSLERGHT